MYFANHRFNKMPEQQRPFSLRRLLVLALCVSTALSAWSFPVWANENTDKLEIPGYEGGIKDARTYREVVFLSGEPVVVEGDISISDRGGRVSYNYRNLTSADGEVTMTRNVTLERETSENGSDQKTETYRVTRYRETINANGNTYEADEDSNEWSLSSVFHSKPAATYFAGHWNGRKVYDINGDEGQINVETRGNRVGYDQHWSSIDTQSLVHYIEYDHENGEDETIRWQGTAQVQASHNRTMTAHFEENEPFQISFRGAYRLRETEENVLKISYDLPRFDENGIPTRQRNLGNDSFTLDTSPNNQMLHIPEMRDIGGHFAEDEIRLLTSLNAFPPETNTFGPDLPVSRAEFARALVVTLGHLREDTVPDRTPSFIREDRQETLFADVNTEHPDHEYIETAYKKGLMTGVDQNRFAPDAVITRAEAVHILVKALGFQHLAPLQQYGTSYRDDEHIPAWARDSAYLVQELGILSDENGYFQPGRELTKADTAVMLNDFIDYLARDLRYDYRERILNH